MGQIDPAALLLYERPFAVRLGDTLRIKLSQVTFFDIF